MKRKKRSLRSVFDDLKGNPERVFLTFRYPVNQKVSEQVVKSLLGIYTKEIEDGKVDYYKRKKEGYCYFMLFLIDVT